MIGLAGWLVAVLALLPALAVAATRPADDTAGPRAQLTDVAISQQRDATVVRIKISVPTKYQADLIDTPDRLVIDLDDALYAWRKVPLAVSRDPVREIRGSQFRKGIARLVIELARPVGYAIREDDDGLTIIIPTIGAPARAASARLRSPLVAPNASGTGAAASSAAASTPAPAAPPAEPRTPVPPPPAAVTPAPVATPPPPAPQLAISGPPVRIAQAAATPAAAGDGQRLISLEFKDADVVNLLRILAAESTRNIVIGEDVKGKMSISLRNVPWELALRTILETKGLEQVEIDGILRIVTREQLQKEREAKARIEEAKLKAEAEIRAKIAEAELKEAEAESKKLAAEAARREQEARGPLREETIRLSYADPEEVAKTLQGILGIPAEGQQIQGPAYVSGPIAEPPFSQLFGPQQPQPAKGPVSVSQEVLAKGLSIRAHKPTNTLFLRLFAADLERVKKIIAESLDIPLPQVKIEARMEILDRTALEQIGIQWGGLWGGESGTTTLVGQGLQTTTGAGGQTVPVQPGFIQGGETIIGLVPIRSGRGFLHSVGAQPSSGEATGGFPISFQTGLPSGGNLVNLPISALPNAGPVPAAGIAFGLVGNTFNLNLALQALATQGKTRTLARPEIVTVENSKATISLGEELPYATISSAGTQIQFKEALLKLEVTPTVIKEAEFTRIKMIVIVENNSRGTTVDLGNAGQPPAINRRKAETQVLIKEGDRLVIGGVLTSQEQNTSRKVPLFGDIPLLGWLFKQRENFEQGRELVLFMTPTVLRSEDRNLASANPGPGAPASATPATR